MSVRRRTPFAQIPEWILQADVSSHAKVLWAALDRFAGLPHGAVPGRATLAREWLHASTDTVDRAKSELIKIGALTVEKRAGETNLYWLEDVPDSRTDAEGIAAPVPRGVSAPVRHKRELVKESNGERNPSAEVSAQERDEVWDALSLATGIVPQSEGERTRFGRSQQDLLKLGATPEEIVTRAAHFVERYPTATLTDRALVNRWGELSSGAPRQRKRRYGTGVTAGEMGDLSKQLKEAGR